MHRSRQSPRGERNQPNRNTQPGPNQPDPRGARGLPANCGKVLSVRVKCPVGRNVQQISLQARALPRDAGQMPPRAPQHAKECKMPRSADCREEVRKRSHWPGHKARLQDMAKRDAGSAQGGQGSRRTPTNNKPNTNPPPARPPPRWPPRALPPRKRGGGSKKKATCSQKHTAVIKKLRCDPHASTGAMPSEDACTELEGSP